MTLLKRLFRMADTPLPLPLIRHPLVDPITGLVTRAWVPWFEAWFTTLNASVEEVDFGIGPEAFLLANEAAIRVLQDAVGILTAKGETITRQGLRDAFDIAARASATQGDPVAVDALALNHKPGIFYQRFALATS
jgi:hypothetical protein